MGKRERRNKQQQTERPPVGAPDAVLSFAAIVSVFGVRTFAAPCVHEDASVAACLVTGRVLLAIGAAALALTLVRLLAADRHTKRSFDFLVAVAGLLFAALPGTMLPLCTDASMGCHTVMLPFARIVGIALIVLSVVCELTVDREVPTGRRRR